MWHEPSVQWGNESIRVHTALAVVMVRAVTCAAMFSTSPPFCYLFSHIKYQVHSLIRKIRGQNIVLKENKSIHRKVGKVCSVQRYYRHFYIFPKHFTWHLWALFWQRGQATAGDSSHVSDVILGCTILLLYFYTVINGHLNKCVVSNWDLCPQSFIDGQFSGFLGCLTKQPINENWLVFYKKNALEKHCRPSLTCLGDMFHSLHGAVCWRGQWQVKQWSSS